MPVVTISCVAQILRIATVRCDIAIFSVTAIVWSERRQSIEPECSFVRPREAQLLRLIAIRAQQEREGVDGLPKTVAESVR